LNFSGEGQRVEITVMNWIGLVSLRKGVENKVTIWTGLVFLRIAG